MHSAARAAPWLFVALAELAGAPGLVTGAWPASAGLGSAFGGPPKKDAIERCFIATPQSGEAAR